VETSTKRTKAASEAKEESNEEEESKPPPTPSKPKPMDFATELSLRLAGKKPPSAPKVVKNETVDEDESLPTSEPVIEKKEPIKKPVASNIFNESEEETDNLFAPKPAVSLAKPNQKSIFDNSDSDTDDFLSPTKSSAQNKADPTLPPSSSTTKNGFGDSEDEIKEEVKKPVANSANKMLEELNKRLGNKQPAVESDDDEFEPKKPTQSAVVTIVEKPPVESKPTLTASKTETKKITIFDDDDDEDEDNVYSFLTKKKETEPPKTTISISNPSKKAEQEVKKPSLFDDDEDEDLFSSSKSMPIGVANKTSNKAEESKQKESFDKKQENPLQSVNNKESQLPESKQKNTESVVSAKEEKKVQPVLPSKSSIFDDEEDDIFTVSKKADVAKAINQKKDSEKKEDDSLKATGLPISSKIEETKVEAPSSVEPEPTQLMAPKPAKPARNLLFDPSALKSSNLFKKVIVENKTDEPEETEQTEGFKFAEKTMNVDFSLPDEPNLPPIPKISEMKGNDTTGDDFSQIETDRTFNETGLRSVQRVMNLKFSKS
jgi:hypothetical protein